MVSEFYEPDKIPTDVRVLTADMDRVVAQLEKTLAHFKAGRPVIQREKEELWKMLKSNIPIEELCHALSGMRFEPKTPTYDPGKHISIFKLWDPERRLKLLTLSTQKAQEIADKRRGA
jgi:hypothetical protein